MGSHFDLIIVCRVADLHIAQQCFENIGESASMWCVVCEAWGVSKGSVNNSFVVLIALCGRDVEEERRG